MKLVIVIDTSLKMPAGKVASQSVHAALSVVRKTTKTKWLSKWRELGEPVVVVAAHGFDELQKLVTRAANFDIPSAYVRDAGHTCVAEGTMTCIGLGPAPSLLMDNITRGLKLL